MDFRVDRPMVTVAQFLRFITRRELARSIDVPKEASTSLEYRGSRIYLEIKKKKSNGRIEPFHGSKVRDITKSSNAVISIVAVCADSSLHRTGPAHNTTCKNIFKVASRDCECG